MINLEAFKDNNATTAHVHRIKEIVMPEPHEGYRFPIREAMDEIETALSKTPALLRVIEGIPKEIETDTKEEVEPIVEVEGDPFIPQEDEDTQQKFERF